MIVLITASRWPYNYEPFTHLVFRCIVTRTGIFPVATLSLESERRLFPRYGTPGPLLVAINVRMRTVQPPHYA